MDQRAIAAENLELIRKMMGSGGRFTAISGLALSGLVDLAGAVFTIYFLRTNQLHSIPGAWLACYGLAVIAGSAVSLAALRLMGTRLLAFDQILKLGGG